MATTITLRQLEYFVGIARHGSMASTASQLHVSAAAVSLGIGELERTLECDLFLRQPHRPLSLTTAGRELLAHATTIVGEADEMQQTAAQRTGSLSGTVHVGCFDTLAPFLVPQLLTVAGERHADLTVDVTEGQSDLLQDQLMDGATDFAILYGLDVRPTFRTEVIWTVRPYVLLAADHPLAECTSIRFAQLQDEPLVLLDSPPSRSHVLAALEAAGVAPAQQRVTHNFETLRSLVARGYGWGVLVQHPEIDCSYEGLPLRRVQISDAVTPAPVVVATHANATLSRRTLACIEVVRSLGLAV